MMSEIRMYRTQMFALSTDPLSATHTQVVLLSVCGWREFFLLRVWIWRTKGGWGMIEEAKG